MTYPSVRSVDPLVWEQPPGLPPPPVPEGLWPSLSDLFAAAHAAHVDSLLPGRRAAAHLPSLTPAQLAERVTNVTHATFISGMNAAFLVAAFLVASILALGGALIAPLAKSGHATEDAAEPSFARA